MRDDQIPLDPNPPVPLSSKIQVLKYKLDTPNFRMIKQNHPQQVLCNQH